VITDDVSKYSLKLSGFKEDLTITDGEIRRTYYDTNVDPPKNIGYIDYRLEPGQIGVFFINDEYQNRGLGKQMLMIAIDDIKNYGTANTVWAVTIKNHPFWHNVWDQSFKYKDPTHSSVTGDGYVMTLDSFNI
jgi:hypothetical protein